MTPKPTATDAAGVPTQTVSPAGDAPLEGTLNDKRMRSILASGFLGNAIETYDFVLYANAAAIVFGPLFFSSLSPIMATVASLATLAVGFFIRPVGAIVFGHFGDKIGRKSVLLATMAIMGVASAAIGLLPTYEQIGVLAPVLLLFLRLLQGFAVGGEWGGGTLVALESAPGKKRGFAGSFTMMGGPAGAVLSFIALGGMAMMPEEEFLSWGWRIPFLASVVLIALGLYVRARVDESPLFHAAKSDAASTERIPFFEIIRRYPRPLAQAVFSGTCFYVFQGLGMTWAVTYATGLGLSNSHAMVIQIIGALGMVVTVGVSAHLSDALGRKNIMFAASVLGILLAFPALWLIQAATFWSVLAGVCLIQWLIQGMVAGPFGAFMSEMFPTRVRYTGISLGFQLATVFGGLTPMTAVALMSWSGGSTITPLALMAIAASAVTIVAVWSAVDGRRKALSSI